VPSSPGPRQTKKNSGTDVSPCESQGSPLPDNKTLAGQYETKAVQNEASRATEANTFEEPPQKA